MGRGVHTVNGIRKDGGRLPLDVSFHQWAGHGARYAIASIVDLTSRLDLEARLAAATNSHLGFPRLGADVAARFSAVELEEVDDAIVNSLRQIGEVLQLECVVLWRKPAGELLAIPTHQWAQPACESSTDNLSIVAVAKTIANLEQGKPCWFASIDDLSDP